jgi:hypothetical protein
MPPVDLPAIIERALSPEHFFLASSAQLRVTRAQKEIRRWEVYLGHLLDPSLARNQATFQAWHVFVDGEESATAPLISVLWDADGERVLVTRQILTHAFEAFEDAPSVILTRPTQKWTSELVGTLELTSVTADETERDLRRLLLLATIGISRLPITSLESPLPDFSLGRLAYREQSASPDSVCNDPIDWLDAALHGALQLEVQSRALETTLRATDIKTVPRIAQSLENAATTAGRNKLWVRGLICNLFNGTALSPYTHFVDALVTLVEQLADRPWFGPQAALETLSYMLRHLCRHLTAFDLTLFHNFGANYPDALFLDVLLRAYLNLLTANPGLCLEAEGTRLRRALRQGCLARRQYEGHRVPDVPTSMGENARVLPAAFGRVPEVQILESSQRKRRLFLNAPTDALLSESARRVLQLSIDELDDPRELQELGMATFLDRPLGVLKQPGEVDRTPLVSHEAYSRFIAIRRLATLKSARWIDQPRHEALRSALTGLATDGILAANIDVRERPGVVALTDANKAASDFMIVRTTRGSLQRLLALYDWKSLEATFPKTVRWLRESADILLLPYTSSESPPQPRLQLLAGTQIRLELGLPSGQSSIDRYRERAGKEVIGRLRVLRILEDDHQLLDLSQSAIWVDAKLGGDPANHPSSSET